ncbi:alpha-amylase family glycosyl hydrolase [Alistipes sp. UBA1686]|uniref:alpha-amylase family glycosyl hydrolase n=1 Tax=Alistipes sp. UBA1686 TaxID=1946007 RepID=UPI00257A5B55|nr:alpha-amylase family glycosyl hydrolase [Alistipes sp. UBA1686]
MYGASSYVDNFTGGRTDFRDETIYFMITTRFYDGDPSNNVLCWDNQTAQISTGDPCWRGDFKGVIDKLDYIKALGFTAIWITPVVQNASGYDYHGYHAMDFSKVDTRYESQDVNFQTLIDKAHEKGIKIILDIVLNHTGNFGEANLCPEFTRSTNILNQASIDACMQPNTSILGSDYASLASGSQYARRLAMMKNTDGVNHDKNNYWHHFGNFNWDNETRWWAQIAGDCVDLNTENPIVYNYLVKCYGEFIKMGVDGFRIDTSGHIARLTFNHAFIPAFQKLGEQYASKRLNGAPFYMFGEVCARYGGVIYREQDALSPFFYTWTSPSKYAWSEDTTEWVGKEYPISEGTNFTNTNMAACEAEYADYSSSNTADFQSSNAFLNGNTYHTPDYSNASGFNVIDFPMHYNFTSAGSAVGIAKSGDNLYNDASWNVVYVDSHDYGPQPSDNIRFSGGTSQWAENLSLMFTFRGIPCIYYGSEIEFRAGKVIDNGPNGALKETGRAYYGGYITGDVSATDFGQYTASGNVAATLNQDLAQHIRRLNLIRKAVPALRKGQYSWDGCSSNGGYAFKRRYTSGSIDSYALVALNAGATFTGVLNGTYTDCITGNTINVSNGTLTTDGFSGQGNLRVYVLNGPGKIGEDGKFLYGSSSSSKASLVSYDGNQEAGTTSYITPDDAVKDAAVTFSPAGSTFKTETTDITATLNASAVSGWYQVGSGAKVNISQTGTFTIGANMAYNDEVTVNWGATGADGVEHTGSETYKKVDPNATITIYVKSSTAPKLYAWNVTNGTTNVLNGGWPGTTMTQTTTIGTDTYYMQSFSNVETLNVIFNNGSAQTADITGITADTYFSWDGTTGYSILPTPSPVTDDSLSLALSTPWATFSSSRDVSFANVSGLKAYVISGYYRVDGNLSMLLTKVTDVPAGTGLLLAGAAGTTYKIPYGCNTAGYQNYLVACTTDQTISATDGSYTNFVLVNNSSNYQFGYLSSSRTMQAGKAYLQLPTSIVPAGAKYISFVEDTATGINELSANASDDAYYSLSGVRVAQPAKGVYIKNGKKYIFK